MVTFILMVLPVVYTVLSALIVTMGSDWFCENTGMQNNIKKTKNMTATALNVFIFHLLFI